MCEWSIRERAQRFIREVKEKSNAIRAGLSYHLPRKLLFELYAFTVDMINTVLNTQKGNYTTPFQLMTLSNFQIPEAAGYWRP